MSYTVRYSGTRNAKFLKASKDALEYHPKAVDILCKEFPTMWKLATNLTMRRLAVNQFALFASFAGIQGFPVRALMRRALGRVPFTIKID